MRRIDGVSIDANAENQAGVESTTEQDGETVRGPAW